MEPQLQPGGPIAVELERGWGCESGPSPLPRPRTVEPLAEIRERSEP